MHLLIVPYNALDGALLGDSEYIAQMSGNGSSVITPEYHTLICFYEDAKLKYKVRIPLKIKDGVIQECFILICVSKDVSREQVETVIDHELGHAKDVLDHSVSYKTLNSDIVLSDALSYDYSSFISDENISRIETVLGRAISSYDSKRSLFKQLPVEAFIGWFISVMYDLNTSEIVQHRKNFFMELKRAYAEGQKQQPDESLDVYLSRISSDYRRYLRILLVLESIDEFMPQIMKKQFIDKFI